MTLVPLVPPMGEVPPENEPFEIVLGFGMKTVMQYTGFKSLLHVAFD